MKKRSIQSVRDDECDLNVCQVKAFVRKYTKKIILSFLDGV